VQRHRDQCLPSTVVRGCLGFLIVVALAGAALGVAIVTVLLPAAASAGVRDSPFLRGQAVRVDVQTSFEGVFLDGRVDRITISGSGLSEPNATVTTADIALIDVSIVDRSFRRAAGTLTDVDVDVASAGALHLETVTLSGSSRALTALADLDATTASTFVRGRLAAAGIPVNAVTFEAGRIDLTIAGVTIAAIPVITSTEVRLEAEGGGVSLPIVAFPSTGEWQITAIQVTPAGIRVTALVSLR
jgi:hypothetical protein